MLGIGFSSLLRLGGGHFRILLCMHYGDFSGCSRGFLFSILRMLEFIASTWRRSMGYWVGTGKRRIITIAFGFCGFSFITSLITKIASSWICIGSLGIYTTVLG